MPLMPKRTKYRKQQKGRNRGKATRGIKVTDGEFGLQATSNGLITTNQIEAARVALTRYIKRGGKVWIKIFGLPEETAKEALRLAANKLSVGCKFVKRESQEGEVEKNED